MYYYSLKPIWIPLSVFYTKESHFAILQIPFCSYSLTTPLYIRAGILAIQCLCDSRIIESSTTIFMIILAKYNLPAFGVTAYSLLTFHLYLCT